MVTLVQFIGLGTRSFLSVEKHLVVFHHIVPSKAQRLRDQREAILCPGLVVLRVGGEPADHTEYLETA